MKKLIPIGALLSLLMFAQCQGPGNGEAVSPLTFSVTYDEALGSDGFDGRMLLLISTNDVREPRFQINDNDNTQQVFGLDVEGLKPGEAAVFTANEFGYPISSLNDFPAGEYYVQALLHKYETFNLSTGYTVKLPMDQGEGQHWNISPKNIYSTPKKVRIDPSKNEVIEIKIDQEIPAIEPVADSEYIKHIRIQSDLLTEFWGRPMYLQANVLVPHGFEKLQM